MPFAPPHSLQIETLASPLADPTLNDNISPPELKVEPRSPPQPLNEDTEVYDNVPNTCKLAKNTSVCKETLAPS